MKYCWKIAISGGILGLGVWGAWEGYKATGGLSGIVVEGRHVAEVSWLPNDATDVTYYREDGGLFPRYWYECTIPYESMLGFARENGWKLEEAEQVEVPARAFLKLPPLIIPGASTPDRLPSALTYVTQQGNGGGIRVAYHRPTSLLIVSYSSN